MRKPRSLAQLLEKWPGAFLLLFTLVYIFGSVCAASRRRFSFDEIFTISLADLPDIRQIWPLIAKGIELNPPLPFWLAWILRHSIGSGEVLSRIPAIAGFWLMCFSLYYFVRHRCGTLWGFVAFLLPIFTYPAWESAVARGYGLMLGASGLALLCWQMVSDRLRRPLSLAGLATALAVAVSCHYYAVYVVGAIALGEIVRTIDSKKVDFGVWLALAAGLSPLIAYQELLRSATAGAMKNFWIPPLPLFLYESYADLWGPTAMVLILLIILTLLPSRNADLSLQEGDDTSWVTPGPRRYELAACFALVAMPLVIFLAAQLGGVPFFYRYVQPVVIGYCAIVTMFAHRIGANNSRFQRQLISLVVWCCLLPWTLWQTYKVVGMMPAARPESRSDFPLDSALPIVIDNESDFLITYYYAPPEVRPRLYHVADRAGTVRFRGTDTGVRSMEVLQTFRDVHSVDYHEFIAHHREFLVARIDEEGWVVQNLLSDGATMELVSLKKDARYATDPTIIFHVVMPSRDR